MYSKQRTILAILTILAFGYGPISTAKTKKKRKGFSEIFHHGKYGIRFNK